MPRADLLALTADDLVALTNRGTVRRATREAADPALTATLAEDDTGTVTAAWSDGPTCTIDADATLTTAHCDCDATVLCRHLVRTVLAYQTHVSGAADGSAAAPGHTGWARQGPADGHRPAPGIRPPAPPGAPTFGAPSGDTSSAPAGGHAPAPEAAAPAPPEASAAPAGPAFAAPAASDVRPAWEPWDPGGIGDEVLAESWTRAALGRIRAAFTGGVVAELVRSAKPVARLDIPGCTVRFLVPGDHRYTVCTCGDDPPCRHVPLAVWAFRLLAPDRSGGMVASGDGPGPPPPGLLDDLEAVVADLLEVGVAGVPDSFAATLARRSAACAEAGLTWPAAIVDELADELDRHRRADARFDPERLARLVGELLIRADAIGASTGPVPQQLVRGTADSVLRVGRQQYTGLGSAVVTARGRTSVVAYLQDAADGGVVTVVRPTTDTVRPYAALATATVRPGVTLRALGAGRLLATGGRRSANRRLALGRSRLAVNPQRFEWERLAAPTGAEGADEIAATLAALPPPALRPRRDGTDVFACPVAAVADARFDPVEQAVMARLIDRHGRTVTLVHPYTDRGAAGCQALLTLLEGDGGVRFVVGAFRLRGGELLVAPISVAYDTASGRRLLQPWIDERLAGEPPVAITLPAMIEGTEPDPVESYVVLLQEAVGELLVTGLDRADHLTARRWRDLAGRGESLGADLLVRDAAELAGQLDDKRHQLRWDRGPAAATTMRLAVMTEVARGM